MDGKLHILIADDSDVVRMALVKTLEDAGHQVVETTNGQEALEMACQQSFDLVITDMKMPKMNGLELIIELRRLKDYQATPILGLTNLNTETILAQLKAAGANGWLQKPFGRDGLLNTLHELDLTG